MNADLTVGLMVLLVSSGLCLLFIFTGEKHGSFPSAPFYVRFGIIFWAGMLLWRGVDLIQLADRPRAAAGHADGNAIWATLALVYLVGSMVFWVCARRLPVLVWDRIGFMFRAMHARPDLVPAVMTSHQVASELRADGFATYEAGEGPEAVEREGLPHARGD